jgi:hypothetical protein
MTAPRCPGGPTYRTERYATRRAWSLESNVDRRPVPVQCEQCGGAWHLVTPEQEGRNA